MIDKNQQESGEIAYFVQKMIEGGYYGILDDVLRSSRTDLQPSHRLLAYLITTFYIAERLKERNSYLYRVKATLLGRGESIEGLK